MQACIELAIWTTVVVQNARKRPRKMVQRYQNYMYVQFVFYWRKSQVPGSISWVVKPILEDKDYTHLCHMMEDVVQLRLDEHQQELHVFDYDKLEFIPQNIASIERSPKQDIIAQHISRFPMWSHSNNSQH